MYPNVTQLETIHRAAADAERLEAERPPSRAKRRRRLRNRLRPGRFG